MTSDTPKRTWPTMLFLAAAVWFAIVSLLPVAEQAWRAMAVAIPFEPSLDAETARLLNDGGILVQVRDDTDSGAATIGRRIEAANHPLRLDILFGPQPAGEAHLVATEALSRGLGAQCLPDAIEPLLQREAAGGDRTYLASLGVEVVQAAYEADRFGRPTLPHWLVLGMAMLCGALAWFSRRLSRTTVPIGFYTPSVSITENRRRLETNLAHIKADAATTRAALAKREAAVPDANKPDWWQQLNVVGRVRERRDAARARAETAALAARLKSLVQAGTAVEVEMSRIELRLSEDRRRFDERVEDRAWMAGVYRQTVGVLAISAAILASMHATVAVAYPGALISSPRFEEMLFRSDTLIATALDAHPDLAAEVGARCFARVLRPEPQDVTVANAAEPSQTGWPIVGPPPPLPPAEGVQHCKIGIPCGNACIPAGRVCHVGQSARIGQECGRGYISMAKTCRVDHTPPPPVTPVMAHAAEAGSPSSVTSTTTFGQPDDGVRYIPPPYPTDVGRGAITPMPSRTTAPTPSAQAPNPPRTVHVEGYDRSNGTHVQSYDRAAPGQGTGRGGRR